METLGGELFCNKNLMLHGFPEAQFHASTLCMSAFLHRFEKEDHYGLTEGLLADSCT